MTKLSHIDDEGEARMVDVSKKAETSRVATAVGRVAMRPATMALIQQGSVKKGDVLSVARLAGIMGAKHTSDLIPLCHPLALNSVDVVLRLDTANAAVLIEATAKVTGRTGVERSGLVHQV